MQRWLCDNFDTDASAPEARTDHVLGQPAAEDQQNATNGRVHTFRVLVNQPTDSNERVAVTGECSILGRWLPAKCVQLNRENG